MSTVLGFDRNPKINDADVVIDRLRIGGKRLDTNLAAAITEATVEYSMDTAATLTIGVRDYDRAVLLSRRLTAGLRAVLRRSDRPGYDRFALARVDKMGDGLTLTFEDEIVYRMRDKISFKKASREKVTRAEFAYSLVKEITHPSALFFSPDIFTVQPIQFSGSVNDSLARNTEDFEDKEGRPYGFSPNERLKVKRATATEEQRGNIARVLTVGVGLKAPKTVLVAMVATIIQESEAKNLNYGDRDSVGLFQQRPSQGWSGLRDIDKAAKQFLLGPSEKGPGGAIEYYRNTRTTSIAKIAQHVQNSAYPDAYRQWEDQSRDAVEKFLGADKFTYRGAPSRVRKVRTAKYEFMRGNPNDLDKKENTWETLRRLAQEVNWRCFVYRGTVYFVSDQDMAKFTAWAIISEQTPGVISLDYSFDAGLPVNEISLSCSAERWSAPPGSVIRITGQGPMVDGAIWLVASYSQSLFSPIATITLRTPEAANPEPPPEIETTDVNIETGDPVEGNSVRSKIVEIAKRELKRAGRDYIYQQTRPYPTSFQQSPVRTDCSGFSAMVYREAGAPDPSGFNYNGAGSTVTQAARGRAVRKPQPGDLVFYGSLTTGGDSGHVAVVINESEAIGFGSQGGPRRHSINYRTPAGYRSYL